MNFYVVNCAIDKSNLQPVTFRIIDFDFTFLPDDFIIRSAFSAFRGSKYVNGSLEMYKNTCESFTLYKTWMKLLSVLRLLFTNKLNIESNLNSCEMFNETAFVLRISTTLK